MRRLLARMLIGLVALLVASLALGRFVPLPSTLMLGRWVTGQDVTREWIPLSRIAPILAEAVIAAEDQRFCQHWGVDLVELQKVLDDEEGVSRGASTLTMQVAKNIYLWPGRSYLRKAIEIPLALLVDISWGKARVMEVYLNVAEWGEGLFGAEAAARHYFGKPASALSPAEAARLAAALPNPLERDPRRPSLASRRISGRITGIAPYSACVTG